MVQPGFLGKLTFRLIRHTESYPRRRPEKTWERKSDAFSVCKVDPSHTAWARQGSHKTKAALLLHSLWRLLWRPLTHTWAKTIFSNHWLRLFSFLGCLPTRQHCYTVAGARWLDDDYSPWQLSLCLHLLLRTIEPFTFKVLWKVSWWRLQQA